MFIIKLGISSVLMVYIAFKSPAKWIRILNHDPLKTDSHIQDHACAVL